MHQKQLLIKIIFIIATKLNAPIILEPNTKLPIKSENSSSSIIKDENQKNDIDFMLSQINFYKKLIILNYKTSQAFLIHKKYSYKKNNQHYTTQQELQEIENIIIESSKIYANLYQELILLINQNENLINDTSLPNDIQKAIKNAKYLLKNNQSVSKKILRIFKTYQEKHISPQQIILTFLINQKFNLEQSMQQQIIEKRLSEKREIYDNKISFQEVQEHHKNIIINFYHHIKKITKLITQYNKEKSSPEKKQELYKQIILQEKTIIQFLQTNNHKTIIQQYSQAIYMPDYFDNVFYSYRFLNLQINFFDMFHKNKEIYLNSQTPKLLTEYINFFNTKDHELHDFINQTQQNIQMIKQYLNENQ